VFLGVLLLAGVFAGVRQSPPDPDTWWHAAVGETILRQGAWPVADPYSFTVAGAPWMAYEWFGEVLMAVAERLGGLRGHRALLLGLAGALVVLLYSYSRLHSENMKAAFIACAIVLPAAAPFFTLRPQLLGYVFLLITLICLERFRRGQQKSLWILPALFLVWVNTHGSFAFGMLLLGWYWLSGLAAFRYGGLTAERWTPSRRRHLALTFLLSLIALTVTPYGTRLAAYPLELALFQPLNTASIQEWQPISSAPMLGAIFLGLLLLLFIGQVLSGRSYRLQELGLLSFAALAASMHRRFLLLFILVVTPVLATMLARWVPAYQPAKDRRTMNAAIMVLILAGILGFFPAEQELSESVARQYPQEAVNYIVQHKVSGPMLNEYGWGGYLIWALGSKHKVFIDGRADIYEYGGVLSDYMNITSLRPGALSVLSKYGVRSCLLQRDAPLAVVLAALPGWDRVYTDSVSALFVSRTAESDSAQPLTKK
jgi:hypothetical protein